MTLDGAVTQLGRLLEQVGRGRPMPADGAVTVLPRPRGSAVAAVLGFTAHHLIAADVDPDWLRSRLSPSSQRGGLPDIGLPMQPDFLAALGTQLNARPGGQDVLLLSTGTDDSASAAQHVATVEGAALSHPRAQRALRYRSAVRVAGLSGGLITIGRGLASRWEVSIEVEGPRRGAGIGRVLATEARALVPAGDLLWAQVHPANVASMRAFLAAGYEPVGAEVLFTREPADPIR